MRCIGCARVPAHARFSRAEPRPNSRRRPLASPRVRPRVLIISTDIGAGHDLPAALLADGLRARGAEVVVEDGVVAMGRLAIWTIRQGAETVLRRFPFLFEVQYWLATQFAPTRRFTQWIGER